MRQTEPSALWNTSMFLSLWVMKVFFLSNEWKMIKLKVNYTELSLLPVTGAAGKWQPTPDSLSFTTLYTCFSAQCLIVGASSWIRASGLRLFIKSWPDNKLCSEGGVSADKHNTTLRAGHRWLLLYEFSVFRKNPAEFIFNSCENNVTAT